MGPIFFSAAFLLFLFMSVMFVVGLKVKDNSLIDIAYGPAFIFSCWGAWVYSPPVMENTRIFLLLFWITLWGGRLGLHIGLRHRGRGEDFRYRQFRADWGATIVWRSFLQIYMLQGLVVFMVSMPVLLVLAAPGAGLQWTDFLGALLCALGFSFEAVADWQLARFKRRPDTKGRIITEGLWSTTRHPNYFGEALFWWGIFLIGLGSPLGLYGLISPLTINFLLLKVSDIPMLEENYKGNPEFEIYKARTSAFFAWIPRGNQHPPTQDSKK